MEMLAELYYAEADDRPEPFRTQQLDMALSLFRFIDAHSRTFSIDRQNKIGAITKMIYSGGKSKKGTLTCVPKVLQLRCPCRAVL